MVPSMYEGFSLPAVEHMASGTPLIASRAGALPEVTGDAAAAGDRLATRRNSPPRSAALLDGEAERASMAERGLARVGERFAWPAVAAATVALLPEGDQRGARVLTVDFTRFPVSPGDRVLDLGCGAGRHAFEAYRRGAHVVAADLDRGELTPVRGMFAAMRAEGEAAPPAAAAPVTRTRRSCRSPTARSTGSSPPRSWSTCRDDGERWRRSPGCCAPAGSRRGHRARLAARAGLLGAVQRVPRGPRRARAHLHPRRAHREAGGGRPDVDRRPPRARPALRRTGG